MSDFAVRVEDLLINSPMLMASEIAEQLGASEQQVVAAFPQEMALMLDGEHAQTLLTALASFGTVTTIVQLAGSVFEFKGAIPEGKLGRGYYNLFGQADEMHGHILLSNIKHVALVSKPFRGKESHYVGFFDADGSNIFKVYLGRDDKHQLLADQVTKFKALVSEFRQNKES